MLAVEIDGDAIAFPFTALAKHVVIEAEVGGQSVAAFWQPGTRSALDRPQIADGAAAAYSPHLDGHGASLKATARSSTRRREAPGAFSGVQPTAR